MRDEFCYMLKRGSAYDWEIVDFSQKERAFKKPKKTGRSQHQEYMTISSRGIVHTLDGEETFITLDEWERELRIFNKLKQIKFFNHYKLWKNFMLWRKLRRRTNFKKKRSFLEANLFIADVKLSDPLLNIRSICYDIQQTSNMIDLSSAAPKTLTVFEEHINRNQIKNTEELNITVNGNIKKILSDSCRDSLKHFKELNRIKNREGGDDGKADGKDDKPMVIGGDPSREMPYTQEATIRIHYKRLKKFIRLIDFLVMDAKLGMVNNSLQKVDKYLDNARNIVATNARNNGGLIPILIVQPEFEDNRILFIPSMDRVIKCFDDSISRGIHYICDQHSSLVNAPEFSTYTKVGETAKDLGTENVDLHHLITNHDTFTWNRDHILQLLTELFDFVVKSSEDLTEILEITIKCIAFHKDMLENKERAEIMEMIESFVEDDEAIKKVVEKLEVGIFSFEREDLKKRIFDMALNCLELIEDHLPEIMTRRSLNYIQSAQVLHAKLTKPIPDVEAFIEHMRVFDECRSEFEDLSQEFQTLQDLTLLFSNEVFRIKCPEDCKLALTNLKINRDLVKKVIDELDDKMDTETVRFKKELSALVPMLDKDRREVEEVLASLDPDNPDRDPAQLSEQLEPLKNHVEEMVQLGEKYQKFQLTLNMDITSIEEVAETRKKVINYYNFWTMKAEWEALMATWEAMPVKDIDSEQVRLKIESNLKKINVLMKEIENNDTFKLFKEEMEKSKGLVIILESFAVKALDEVEWEEIKNLMRHDSTITYFDFQYASEEFKLPQVHAMNMVKYKNEISEIAMRAAKERDLKARLEKISGFLKSPTIVMDGYKGEKDVFILGNNDELIKKLDNTLVDVRNVLSNKYVSRIKEQVQGEQRKLLYFQQFIDEICFCQRMWLYLEPIFNSDENNKELMNEKKIFKRDVHKPFIKITKELNDKPQYLIGRVVKPNTAGTNNVNRELEKIHQELESLEKKLISYLEQKRKMFPRFYFISNDDLIEILSQAKDFDKVQGHLNKLFEAIKKIYIDGNGQMKGMISPEGEIVIFDVVAPQLNTSEPITETLNKIENSMQLTVKAIIRAAVKDIKERPPDQRTAWLMSNHSAQSILTADSIIWTQSVENSIEYGDELEQVLDQMIIDLKDVIDKVRSKLTKEKRRMINSLITQDVHYRDIVETILSDEIESKDDFKWQQQLRFYQQTNQPEIVLGRQVNSELLYGNEYLGVPTKLAITPLTDRCWMTITCALYLNLGCSPVGPAGTGKTESTKDLAKNLGTLCIVYNCSEQVTVSMMSTQFMGVMSTGAWLCLDEFNRIDIEVLSVIAQQILAMKNALNLRKEHSSTSDETAFFFDGQPIDVSSVSHFKYLTVFTTMNPGYAGRTELPDNLKVLFRSVSMMVPDYALIAEILLFSEGFFNAKDLAVKLTKLYKLASEQLSQQQHYDFGMRAVKSILSMAGNLKRANPNEDEDLLLIQAMKDTNIPKFLEVDITLFEAIVQDLFPKKNNEKKINQRFLTEMTKIIEANHLQTIPRFIEKCCQFDDIMKIRFGNMLIGPPMTGKSAVLKVLHQTYTTMSDELPEEYNPVDCVIINPKSITMGELLGETNPKTGDFTNGLASKVFADFASREKKELKWIVFDGPVDSLWIENLNSVLDDSMTLCLANGKRIKLRLDMRVLFEVQDLAQASPATVSRIGMVYMDSDTISYIQLIKTLFKTEFEGIDIPTSHKEGYIQRADVYFDKLLLHIRRYSKEPTKTINNNLAYSFVKIIRTFYMLDEYKNRFPIEDEEEVKKVDQSIIGKIFTFATAWAIMSTVDEHSSYKLDQIASNLLNANDLPPGSMFDCFVDLSEKEHHWVKWDSVIQEFEFAPTMRWSEILVPTINTKRFSYLVRRAILTRYPIYLSGITGTGKTVLVQNVIKEMSDGGLITPLPFTFSAKTSSNQLQATIVSKMNILRPYRKTINGNERIHCLKPKSLKTLVVNIDDINMPEVETFGAQPPIELLRQTIDQKGFYDRQQLHWMEIEDTVFVATSVPPGNGRATLSDRFMRHFHILNIQSSSDEIMKSIFGQILKGFFNSFEFKPKIKGMDGQLVMGTLLLYREMVKKMLPTPKKSHYAFNLRDVSKVFQGLVKMRPQRFQDSDTVAKLWIHECTRVFGDRLATPKDREFFAQTLASLSGTYSGMSVSADEIIHDKFLFGDFMNPATRELENLDKMDKIVKTIATYMYDTPVQIELFADSIKHLCRLNRILRQVGGHGLLIGIGGSGKKSLVTVAAEMAGTMLRTIEPTRNYGITEFRKEVFEKMLQPAGVYGKDVTFLLTDTHIVEESFLEDINNLINTGEIVLDRETMEILKKNLEAELARLKINEDPIEWYVKQVRDKLHIMLAMSPIGDALRTRVRNFPSFVNCCTIDWLDPWPTEALMTVAKKMLEETFKEQAIDAPTGLQICTSCVESHEESIQAADKFLLTLRRKVFITPKTYIDLIKTFRLVLKELKGNIDENITKLSNGLSKLIESGEKVEYYKEEIARMKPVLEQKNIKVQELIEKLSIEKGIVDKQAVVVEKEKTVVQAKAEQVSEIKKDAEAEYKRAQPILEAALKALNVLDRNDIASLKSAATNEKSGQVYKDLFESIQLLLGRPTDFNSIKATYTAAGVIEHLKKVDPKDITKEVANQVSKKIRGNATFDSVEKLKSINSTLISLVAWVKGIVDAQDSAETCKKLEAKADEIAKVYEGQMSALQKKQDELDLVLQKLAQLENAYNASKKEKDDLDANLAKTNMMLENSGKLTQGLADEHVRWIETVKNLEHSKVFIIGDAFLSSACIAYHGPFSGIFRQAMLTSWQQSLEKNKIKSSPAFAFEDCIGDISLIRKWNVFGLPSNKISVCNGILASRSPSFPFMIDPQLQANKWLKKLEADNELQCVKANDTLDLSRKIDLCLQSNYPILIEDADEAINPYLDPLLLKQFTVRGNNRFIKLGEGEETLVDPNFRLYFTTKISNPNFLPELFIRVSIINFTVTEDGLEEQLLAEVIREIMPEIEEKRVTLIVNIAEGKNELRRNEDLILADLKNSKGNILENNPLIENLENSKRKSEEVKATLEINEFTQKQINQARDQYRPVAARGSLLYFIICDLAEIDPMYQFSLNYVTRLFVNTIRSSPKSENTKELCQLFVDKITENIYLNVCRGLFNEHKKIFAFLVASRIQKVLKLIKKLEWDLFLKGIPLAAIFKTLKMPSSVQVDEKYWERMFYFASFSEVVRDLVETMQRDNGLLTAVADQWIKSANPLQAPYLETLKTRYRSSKSS